MVGTLSSKLTPKLQYLQKTQHPLTVETKQRRFEEYCFEPSYLYDRNLPTHIPLSRTSFAWSGIAARNGSVASSWLAPDPYFVHSNKLWEGGSSPFVVLTALEAAVPPVVIHLCWSEKDTSDWHCPRSAPKPSRLLKCSTHHRSTKPSGGDMVRTILGEIEPGCSKYLRVAYWAGSNVQHGMYCFRYRSYDITADEAKLLQYPIPTAATNKNNSLVVLEQPMVHHEDLSVTDFWTRRFLFCSWRISRSKHRHSRNKNRLKMQCRRRPEQFALWSSDSYRSDVPLRRMRPDVLHHPPLSTVYRTFGS